MLDDAVRAPSHPPPTPPIATLAASAVAERTAVSNLGEDKWNTTYYPTGSDAAAVNKPWFVIDAEGQTLGRLANLAAFYIRGKNSVLYTPSMDMGAFIVVINADKVAVTGSKETDKLYHRHVVGRPGSWRTEALRDLRKRIPERIVEKAVKGMLPKGRIGRHLFTHLKASAAVAEAMAVARRVCMRCVRAGCRGGCRSPSRARACRPSPTPTLARAVLLAGVQGPQPPALCSAAGGHHCPHQ